ncbi:MAG: hypothetical protein WBQ86_02595 [Candidatus Binatus sp.]
MQIGELDGIDPIGPAQFLQERGDTLIRRWMSREAVGRLDRPVTLGEFQRIGRNG